MTFIFRYRIIIIIITRSHKGVSKGVRIMKNYDINILRKKIRNINLFVIKFKIKVLVYERFLFS